MKNFEKIDFFLFNICISDIQKSNAKGRVTTYKYFISSFQRYQSR